jgi:hypothetical protein
MHSIRTIAAATAVVAGVALPAAAEAHAGRDVLHGGFTETAVGEALDYDIGGVAVMIVGADSTDVHVVARGLDPAKTYGSHLHNGTCASGGGGHYQDSEGGATTPPNELWITNVGTGLVSRPSGVAVGSGTAAWQARTGAAAQTNARSIVIHEPGGARIACADLS